jgi:hypothetical protein
MSPPIQVPSRSGRRCSGYRLDQLAREPRQRLPDARLDEPEPVADLVDDAGATRPDLVRLPQDRDLLFDLLPDSPLCRVRQLRVVEPSQGGCESLVSLEDRAPGRLGRMCGENGTHLEPGRSCPELLVADTGSAKARDGIDERLVRHASFSLVLPSPP